MQLTKLEQVAAMCLQGFLSNSSISQINQDSMTEIAIDFASKLIEKLPKEETRRRVLVASFRFEGNNRINFTFQGWFIQFSQYSNQDNESGLSAYVEMDNGDVIDCSAESIKFI